MVSKNEKKFKAQSIKQLHFSEDFKQVAKKLDFKTLDEILQNDAASLLKLAGFTYHMMQELVQFLVKNNLAHLLKQ